MQAAMHPTPARHPCASPLDRPPRSGHRSNRGFTLIEIIAVAAIIAMILALGIPQLGRRAFDGLNDEAEMIAERLRFARQRAVMTGVPHRLLIDLEEGGYRIEWYVDEGRAFSAISDEDAGGGGFGALLAGGPGLPDSDGASRALDLTPTREGQREYHPIPHREMGSFRWIDETLYFVGADGPGGWVESGDYAVVFFADGTTEPARLELADSDDRHVTLAIEALLERVAIERGEARS